METKNKIIKSFWTFFQNNRDTPVLICVGGAGSGKSHSLCQWLIYLLYKEENKRFLILRKTLPSLRITTYRMILDLLEEYGLAYTLNRAEMTLKVGTNIVWFRSLDQPEKIKSLNLNIAYLEEASELSYRDFLQIRLRMRRKSNTQNQIYMSLNPISQYLWVKGEVIEKQANIAVHYSTYHINPFLPQSYKEELENLKAQDEGFYNVYTLGKWGVLRNTIYPNYVIESFDNIHFDETIYGLDFGFSFPNALLEVGIKDKEYYLTEQLYQTHMTNQDLIAELKDVIKPKSDAMYADSAEPARIEEISKAGFDVYPANKSVKDGIDYVKSQKLHIDKNSVNLISEIRTYKYKEDRNGNVLEDPVKFRDHLMDCIRYALYSHSRQQKQDVTIPTYYIPDLSHTPTRGRHS
jgi:phage terminase large subunit